MESIENWKVSYYPNSLATSFFRLIIKIEVLESRNSKLAIFEVQERDALML